MAKTLVFVDPERVVSGWHADGRLRVWAFRDGELQLTAAVPAHEGPIGIMALSPGGILATSAGDAALRLWSLGSGTPEELQILVSAEADPITTAAFSLDGSLLALGTAGGRLQLWRQGTLGFESAGTVDAHRDGIASLSFHPDGIRLFTGGDDWMIRVWRATGSGGWEPLGQMKGHSARVTGLSFNSKNWVLASSGEESSVRVWTGEGDIPVELTALRGYAAAVTDVAYSPSGKLLASSSRDNWVKVWQQIGEIFGLAGSLGSHQTPVLSVAFAPDSRHLVSQSEDGQVKCWRVSGA